jgi:cell division protein FtsW
MMRKHIDYTLLLATLLLVGIGITMIYSSSAILARERFGEAHFFLQRELISVVIGLAALAAGRLIPINYYRRYTYAIFLVAIALLCLVHMPGIGVRAGGATRWIQIAGLSFQPSEFAKIALVFFVAYALDKKKEKIRNFGIGFLPTMALSMVLVFLVLLGKDLGTAFLMVITVLGMMYVAGARPSYLIAQVLIAFPVLYQLITSVAYRRRRILAFLNPWEHRQTEGFQIIQSFLAFQAGGLFGVGLGEGKQKLFYLPEAHTDFIFSVLAEELGLLGVLSVLLLFAVWIFRAVSIAWQTQDWYSRFLALGLSLSIGWLALLNMAVVMGLLPTKGIPLPFISYGGTSLIMSLFAVGVLLNISAQSEEESRT